MILMYWFKTFEGAIKYLSFVKKCNGKGNNRTKFAYINKTIAILMS